MAKQIIVLGATGDIGSQALELLRYSFDYELVGVAFKSNCTAFEKNLPYFDKVNCIAIENKEAADEFISRHSAYKKTVFSGEDGIKKLLSYYPNATVLNAISGNDGIIPTLLALENDQDLLLANKESYVVGSSLMKEKMKTYNGMVYPIDSEHVGLSKCLRYISKHHKDNELRKMTITASGGALRDFPLEKMANAKKEDVLKHPTWKMSSKITVDCATLVNKGYEVIEASEMFSVPVDMIEAVICRDSLVHAGVYFMNHKKGEYLACFEYSPCDMKVAIAFALSKGKLGMHICNIDEYENLQRHVKEFVPIDKKRYPLFYLTKKCFAKYGNEGMFYYNAVDTKAIEAFLADEIMFFEIQKALEYIVDNMPRLERLSENNLKKFISSSEIYATELLNKKSWRLL